jgi:hypothetical protein
LNKYGYDLLSEDYSYFRTPNKRERGDAGRGICYFEHNIRSLFVTDIELTRTTDGSILHGVVEETDSQRKEWRINELIDRATGKVDFHFFLNQKNSFRVIKGDSVIPQSSNPNDNLETLDHQPQGHLKDIHQNSEKRPGWGRSNSMLVPQTIGRQFKEPKKDFQRQTAGSQRKDTSRKQYPVVTFHMRTQREVQNTNEIEKELVSFLQLAFHEYFLEMTFSAYMLRDSTIRVDRSYQVLAKILTSFSWESGMPVSFRRQTFRNQAYLTYLFSYFLQLAELLIATFGKHCRSFKTVLSHKTRDVVKRSPSMSHMKAQGSAPADTPADTLGALDIMESANGRNTPNARSRSKSTLEGVHSSPTLEHPKSEFVKEKPGASTHPRKTKKKQKAKVNKPADVLDSMFSFCCLEEFKNNFLPIFTKRENLFNDSEMNFTLAIVPEELWFTDVYGDSPPDPNQPEETQDPPDDKYDSILLFQPSDFEVPSDPPRKIHFPPRRFIYLVDFGYQKIETYSYNLRDDLLLRLSDTINRFNSLLYLKRDFFKFASMQKLGFPYKADMIRVQDKNKPAASRYTELLNRVNSRSGASPLTNYTDLAKFLLFECRSDNEAVAEILKLMPNEDSQSRDVFIVNDFYNVQLSFINNVNNADLPLVSLPEVNSPAPKKPKQLRHFAPKLLQFGTALSGQESHRNQD